jgi:hypothetical protein
MRSLPWTGITILLSASLAPWAQAQTTINPVTTTAISGYNAAQLTWLAVGEGPIGIKAVRWFEDGDKPCFMQIYQRALSGSPVSDFGAQLDICGGNDIGVPGAGSWEKTVTFDGYPRYYIRGVSVCTNNNSNHRLKGIRIYAAKVWATEERVDQLSTKDEKDRPNCANWHPAVFCPADNIASALVVHHSDKEVTGLALRCRRVDY